MAIAVNLDKALDKKYEAASLEELLAAPPSALAGLTPAHDEILSGLGIKTIADLGSNKYFALAGVLVALGNKQG
jgi:predicted RecB family nuclease